METNIKYSEVGGYKIFKIGGFIVRGRGYSQIPPASKLKSQTPHLILKKSRFHFVPLSFSKKQDMDVEGLQPHTLIHLIRVFT